MYSTCIFCNRQLGTNEVIESFPVGRRVAFDSAKGRLWVVCRKCEKWNLSPFEQRWEALEDCERRFHNARKRVSTDNIGLARLDEGLELVRIGEPLRPEFAAWRYGDQFGRRRRKAIAMTAAAGAAGGVLIAGGVATGILAGGGWGIYYGLDAAIKALWRRRRVVRVPLQDGGTLTVRDTDLQWIRLLSGSDPDELRLTLWYPTGETVLTGAEALNATALIMPRINRSGAKQRQVQRAVLRIEQCEDPVSYLQEAALEASRQTQDLAKWSPRHVRMKAGALEKLPVETRLAIEMAINEENERCALEGELALLELAWQEAEEIAAIADRLALPADVEERFKQIQRDG